MLINFKKDKNLIKKSSKIILSIIFSQMILTAVGFLDVFMIIGADKTGLSYSAVGIGSEIWYMFQAPTWAIIAIFGILYSQFKNENKKFTALAKINIYFFVALGIVISLFLLFLGDKFVDMFFISDKGDNYDLEDKNKIKSITYDYLKILAVGNLFYITANSVVNPLVMIGNAKYTFYLSITAFVSNLTFNSIFIYGLKLGVTGAGWSTSISYFLQLLLASLFLSKNRNLFTGFGNIFKIDFKILKRISSFWLLFISNLILYWSYAFETILITWGYGSEIMKSLFIAYSIGGIIFSVIPAIRKSAIIMVGNELGKNKLYKAKDNAKKVIWVINFFVLIIAITSLSLGATIPEKVLQEDEYIKISSSIIFIFAAKLFAESWQTYYSAILESGGKQVASSIFGFWFILWCKLPLMVLLMRWGLDLDFIYMYAISNLITYVFAFILFLFYKRDKWVNNLNVPVVV